MKRKIYLAVRYTGLVVVTVLACGLMWAVTAGIGPFGFETDRGAVRDPEAQLPVLPVAVVRAEPQFVEITARYAGILDPFERYRVSFEVGGRVRELGENAQGRPLDEGDPVQQGQVLAMLDDRVLLAQLAEAKANVEKAQSDMQRANEIRNRKVQSISEAEYQRYVTELALAEARFQIAEKNLQDAVIKSPTDGVINKRHIKAGESVSPHEAVFELVEVDVVLLRLGVPESRISEVRVGQTVHVELLARDVFQQKLPSVQGKVYRIAETADDSTGLFPVEVEVENRDGELRPGQVAVGRIVLDTMQAVRLPISSAVFRDDRAYLYAVGEEGKAREIELDRWIEQGSGLIVPELAQSHRQVVVRGQHRLVDGRPVQVVSSETVAELNLAPQITPRAAEVGSSR